MKRHSRGSAFVDLSIHGDELEADRIQLEHNLQNTELSFHLSSASEDDHYPPHRHDSSLEYPRHISEPSIPDFPSFSHRSRDNFGDEENSHLRGWSYRTGDDDEGINPYGGETQSTAAHHASALTLTAGLGGGRGARREQSLSAAEYDPERPLHAMIAGVNSRHSMFDTDPSKNTAMGMTYDPLVVDSTAELDRILESGHAPPPNMQMQPPPTNLRPPSPISSASSSTSDSDARHPLSPRPKLADHLRHVSFSPKRPRSGASPLNRSRAALPNLTADTNNSSMYTNARTPRAASHTHQPQVRLQPATPSSAGSRFTRMARGIHKELEETQEQLNRHQAAASSAPLARPASAPAERNPFHDTPQPGRGGNTSARRDLNSSTNTTKGRIHLPDVTGLTAAVESPAKPGMEYHKYAGNGRPRDSEVRLIQTLNAVQGQLQDLEEENGISRRRVRELEMELDECKREVARERTKLFEREERSVRRLQDLKAGTSQGKQKAKAKAVPEEDDERLHARYKEAVDEKKALEALITSLRTHLTRLTSELASHQILLASLRQLRDADAASLRERSSDILQLKEEVQRLAGEVEVLRGVVEEGLKERRASREMSAVDIPEEDRGMSRDLEEEEEEEADELAADEESAYEMEDMEESEEEQEEEEPEPFDPASLDEQRNHAAADRTMRTDFATLGGSTNTNSARERLVDVQELDDIAAELEERRSNVSNGSLRVRSPVPGRRTRQATVEEVEDVDERRRRRHREQQQQHQHYTQQQEQISTNQHARARTHPEPSTSRPSAPTPNHAARRPHSYNPNASGFPMRSSTPTQQEPETPFPQIRGEQLERMFFSAPEHNAKTCTVCFRRRDREQGAGGISPTGWSRPRGEQREREREEGGQHSDEGYEGSEGADAERPATVRASAEAILLGGDMAQWRKVAKRQGVPPQTVVARVVRELEDDFTHYKSVYVELADQYKVMDAASDVRRRNTLAKHLREVVDILEQKGDQIASLYDLLQFKDKPVSESVVPDRVTAIEVPLWGRASSAKRQ
ncbi:hypothetical protein BDN70DRAFT_996996 [Pholiota conissans]|uniref:Cep57 centrosome microtubule-binding domain-containing protein n=1 Tax=Pholiota conissans TaxID=109636 RepID=A0A9P6CPD4_9AGAR|nr:hypothetical protein BDN70DRAFT_996996 [Pholiota conissans]